MSDETSTFWVTIAQLLPVFILALVVEARAAVKTPFKKGTSVTFSQFAYLGLYVVPMAALVVAFGFSILTIEEQQFPASLKGVVTFCTIADAVITDGLPVARIGGALMIRTLKLLSHGATHSARKNSFRLHRAHLWIRFDQRQDVPARDGTIQMTTTNKPKTPAVDPTMAASRTDLLAALKAKGYIAHQLHCVDPARCARVV